MRITTWNVNSLRARLDRVTSWIEVHRPEVICLQETKLRDEVFPHDDFEAMGYEVAHWGENQWNGVAIASRVGLQDVTRSFTPEFAHRGEGRFLTAYVGGTKGCWVSSAYVPNGRALDDPHFVWKLEFLDGLVEMAKARVDTDWVVLGDFNVAPEDKDIWDPSRFRNRTHASPEERSRLAALVELGMVDTVRSLDPGKEQLFTWWDYRLGSFARGWGLRIDLAYATPSLARRLSAYEVDVEERAGEKPSDHAPVTITFD